MQSIVIFISGIILGLLICSVFFKQKHDKQDISFPSIFVTNIKKVKDVDREIFNLNNSEKYFFKKYIKTFNKYNNTHIKMFFSLIIPAVEQINSNKPEDATSIKESVDLLESEMQSFFVEQYSILENLQVKKEDLDIIAKKDIKDLLIEINKKCEEMLSISKILFQITNERISLKKQLKLSDIKNLEKELEQRDVDLFNLRDKLIDKIHSYV